MNADRTNEICGRCEYEGIIALPEIFDYVIELSTPVSRRRDAKCEVNVDALVTGEALKTAETEQSVFRMPGTISIMTPRAAWRNLRLVWSCACSSRS